MRKKIKRDIKQPIVIVSSSELIATYFSQMRKDCRYDNLTVVSAPSKTLKDLLTKTARIKNNGRYKMAWCVFSPSEFADATATNIIEYEKSYEPRKIGLAYTAHSIMLYWALHFQTVSGDESADALNEIIKKYIPSFKHSIEYLQGPGSNLHLTLFSRKAMASSNALPLNTAYRLKNGIDAINFTKLLNSISEYCGEADIVKNQKVASAS